MKKQRKAPSYSDRLAATLVHLRRGDGTPLIPDDVRAKGKKAVLAHVEWDHNVPVALGGDNHPSNIQPLTKEDHAVKTKRDIASIAKVKRLTVKQEEFRRRMLAKAGIGESDGEPPSNSPSPKRRWKPDGHRYDWRRKRYVKEAAE